MQNLFKMEKHPSEMSRESNVALKQKDSYIEENKHSHSFSNNSSKLSPFIS